MDLYSDFIQNVKSSLYSSVLTALLLSGLLSGPSTSLAAQKKINVAKKNEISTKKCQEALVDRIDQRQGLAQWNLVKGEAFSEKVFGLTFDDIKPQLDDIIQYEILKNANHEKNFFIGIEPNSVLDRQEKLGIGGASSGAPLSGFMVKIFGVPFVASSPNSKGAVELSVMVSFIPHPFFSPYSSTAISTYRWLKSVEIKVLTAGIHRPPVTAVIDKADKSRRFVLSQVSLETLTKYAKSGEMETADFPYLAQIADKLAKKDEDGSPLWKADILGFWIESRETIESRRIFIRLSGLATNESDLYLKIHYDWANNRPLEEYLSSKSEFDATRNVQDGSTDIAYGLSVEPTPLRMVAPQGEQSYAVIMSPDYLLYTPGSARSIVGALMNEVQRLIDSPTKESKGLDLKVLRDALFLDPRLFGYQVMKEGSVRLGIPQRIHEGIDPVRVRVSGFEMGNILPQWVILLWRLSANEFITRKGDPAYSHYGKVPKLRLPYCREQEFSDGDFLYLGEVKDTPVTINANHPGEHISYEEAMQFIEWFNELPEIKASGYHYDLPSEAQWRYAYVYLGSGKKSKTYSPISESEAEDYVWHIRNQPWRGGEDREGWNPKGTTALGEKRAFPNGIYDMVGMVRVFTKDSGGINQRKLGFERDELDPVKTEGSMVFCAGVSGQDSDLQKVLAGGTSRVYQYESPCMRTSDIGIQMIRKKREIE